MPEIEIDIELYCERCGAGLCNQAASARTRTRNYPSFRIEPCQRCLETARDEGYDKGYDKGLAEGRAEAAGEGKP